MELLEWRELNERLAKDFRLFCDTTAKGEVISNARALFSLLSDSFKVAGQLNGGSNETSLSAIYNYEANGQILAFGPATAILDNLPDPKSFPIGDSGNFYFQLIESSLNNQLPDDLFFQAFNYANRLLPYATKYGCYQATEIYENLEKRLRQRLISKELLKIIVLVESNEHPLVTAYWQSLRRVADTYLRNRDYAGAVGCLIREIDVFYPEIPEISKWMKYQNLVLLQYYNRLLGVLPPLELLPEVNRLESQIDDTQIEWIHNLYDLRIEDLELSAIKIQLEKGFIPLNSHTIISLAIVTDLPEGIYEVDQWRIGISRQTDPFCDPNFLIAHNQPIVIAGMPLAVLSEALWQAGGVTIIELSSKSPFHPDIKVDDRGEICGSLSDQLRQMYGDDYDPYLAKVIELLRQVRSDEWPDENELFAALKSLDSYVLSFVDAGGATTHQIFQPLVRLGKFLSVRTRFLTTFDRAVKNGHAANSLKSLLFGESRMDADGLLRYASAVFCELIGRESERGEWWKTVWVEGGEFRDVRNEPDVQRDISNIVSKWFSIKGLIFDREVRASGGSIDMLVTSASGNKFHRCGIELKFAHHSTVLNGVSKQLPDYMDDLEAEVGIFLTLWCKGDKFQKPAKYLEISDLHRELCDSIPPGKRIEIISVNASYRPPPSKRK